MALGVGNAIDFDNTSVSASSDTAQNATGS